MSKLNLEYTSDIEDEEDLTLDENKMKIVSKDSNNIESYVDSDDETDDKKNDAIDDEDNEESKLLSEEEEDFESDIDIDIDIDDVTDNELIIAESVNDIDFKKTYSKKMFRSKVFKNKKYKIIKDKDERITKNILNKYELAKVVSERANSIENNAIPLVPYDDTMSPKLITYKELINKKCPYYIYRHIPNFKENVYEKWDVNEMIIPNLPDITYIS